MIESEIKKNKLIIIYYAREHSRQNCSRRNQKI
jgi:hypothetical protein